MTGKNKSRIYRALEKNAEIWDLYFTQIREGHAAYQALAKEHGPIEGLRIWLNHLFDS